MSKNSKFYNVFNTIMLMASTYIMIKFGVQVRDMIYTIIEHVKLGTELHIVLQEPMFALLVPYMISVVYCTVNTYLGVDRLVDWIIEKTTITQEEKDMKAFIKWMKKESKRLHKLEGTL